MINFRAGLGVADIRATLSMHRNTSRQHYSFVDLFFYQARSVRESAKYELSIKMANSIHSTLIIL